MRRVGFRVRLLFILALFAVLPAALVAVVASVGASYLLREVGGPEPWERVAESGRAALDVINTDSLSTAQVTLLNAHRDELSRSLTNARRLGVLARTAPGAAVLLTALLLALLALVTTRVAGHLSRQMSRPLQELVGWTERMAKGERLPEQASARGAPEFEVLRQRMRRTARELAKGRERALEAERLRAFRETARQVAHELKNPLTPIRFAVDRLRRQEHNDQREIVEVLDVETRRMEEIARSFAVFGRLPEGPRAAVDIGEMVSYAARSAVPETRNLTINIEPGLPHINAHHDALSRALVNVLLNAVQATGSGDSIEVTVKLQRDPGRAINITVSDGGSGIAEQQLARIWEPYTTHRVGGTGLGLAIVRQTIEAHGGTVAAESDEGVGTRIFFTLPVDGVANSTSEPVESR